MLAASRGCLRQGWPRPLSEGPPASVLSQLTSSPQQTQSGLFSAGKHESLHDLKERKKKKSNNPQIKKNPRFFSFKKI